MIKTLINFGLLAIPFFLWPGMKTREPKMLLAVGVALALSLWAFFAGKVRPFKNKWALILVGYLLISIYLSPKPVAILFGINIQNIWVWKPMFDILVFFMMLVTISSIRFTERDKRVMFKCMVWAGFIMSLYVILQATNWGLDQWFNVATHHEAQYTKMAHIGGTLGHSTIVSPFIAMIIPIAIYLKKYLMAVVMAGAVLLCESHVATAAMVVSLLFLIAMKGKKQFIFTSLVVLCAGVILIGGRQVSTKIRNFTDGSGRYKVWANMLEDMKAPINDKTKLIYPITGFGMGTFKFLYHEKHPSERSPLLQAHNDYFELGYNGGIGGLFLFLCAIWWMFAKNISIKKLWFGNFEPDYKYRTHLLGSFICIAVCAGGVFVWQLNPHIFYTIVVVGLLHNKEEKNEEAICY